MLRWFWAAVLLLVASPALAQVPERAPVPEWVVQAALDPVPAVDPAGAPFRPLEWDRQIRFNEAATEQYARARTLIQTTQGLSAAGTIVAPWNPASQSLIIHAVNIVRGDQTIDVLATQSFDVIRREQNLESSMIDGVLTATLQPADLRVGDVLDVAYSIRTFDPVVGRRGDVLVGGQFAFPVGRFRFRASWTADRALQVRALAPWTLPTPQIGADGQSVELALDDLRPLEVPTNTPTRFQHVRQIELSDWGSWGEISSMMAPLFDRAAILPADSPLQAEIERIAREHATPEARTAAALRLVQDDVRYLALAMGEGGLVPATADETWRVRFGDCKGKTALLIALLHGLGIEAEPALVSTIFGDGLDQRLPMLSLFDHVLVRAVIDGRTYWIDGTRIGDRTLAGAPSPPYRWALPVRTSGAVLEAIIQPSLDVPLVRLDMTIDASAGLATRASVIGQMTMTGDLATGMRAAVGNATAAQRDEGFRGMWAGATEGLEISSVDGVYDSEGGTFTLTMIGAARLDWNNGPTGRRFELPDSAISFPIPAARPAGPYADLPFIVSHPSYLLSRLTLRLPTGVDGFVTEGADIDALIGGYSLVRTTTLEGGEVVLTKINRSLTGELSAAQVEEARTQLAALDNDPVRVRAPAGYRATEGDLAAGREATDDVAVLLQRGGTLMEQGDFAGAMTAFDRVLELTPDDAHALAARGVLHLQADELDAARADLARATELDSTLIYAIDAQGRLAIREQRFDDAVLEYSVSLRLARDNVDALYGRAWAHRRMGRLDRALADYRAAAALAPEDDGRRQPVLDALVDLGRIDEARTMIDGLLAGNPATVSALVVSAQIARDAGRPADALPALDAGLAVSPDDTELRNLRAEHRILTGDEAGAVEDLAHARALAAGDATQLNSLCWTQARLAFSLEQALADCDAALAAEPGIAAFIDSRAMVLLQMGRLDDARAAYDEALGLAPNLPASLYGRGLTRQALGDVEGGATDIAAALSFDPEAAVDFSGYVGRRDGVDPAGSPAATGP